MSVGKIKKIEAREIIDSRSDPTLETTIWLDNDIAALASVPSGSSKGKHESLELRDNDLKRFHGKGVLTAIKNVNEKIGPALVGMEIDDQAGIDRKMISLDGTDNKSELGANATLSVSLATCRTSAYAKKLPLYRRVAECFANTEPLKVPPPLMNLINGGKHGAGNLDFQEFHVIPLGYPKFSDALRVGIEIYQSVENVLINHGAIHSVGDEGGFAPNLFTNIDALEVLADAIKEVGVKLGKDVFLSLDVAASNFYKDGRYKIKDRTMPLSPDELIEYYRDLNNEYPLYILEDPLYEDDWGNWIRLTAEMENVTVVGDDLLATNLQRTEKAIREKACGAALIKPNQVGTLTETMEVIRKAKEAGWKVIVSHRSGETTDDFIADFAVGVGADIVKFGAPARGERVVKYNRLMAIEKELEQNAST
ncbi:phosphopyruvate hydratase [Patescibacteria group bacterium]|nr:phosphopyruvate hydratase [Patescibacteria group bacterium]